MKSMTTRKTLALVTGLAMVSSLAACGSGGSQASNSSFESGGKTELTVWAWEPTLKGVVPKFEAKNPNIKIKLQNVGTGNKAYTALDNALQAGSGVPDVAQIEYMAIPQYAIGKHLTDITDKTNDYKGFYTPGTWSSVHWGGKVYGLPMDSGPMAFFYNKEVFDKAGVDATQIKTWDEYYEAAKKVKATGSVIMVDYGDAGVYDAMSWLAGGQPFKTSNDGSRVTINLTGDAKTKEFTRFWQKMISEGLMDTKTAPWTEEWFKGFSDGSIAGLLTGAWMPANFANSAAGAAGKWRVAPMPTPDGKPTNSELGGSSLAIMAPTKKADAAWKFIEFANHDSEGIKTRVEGGAFPADPKTLKSKEFLDTTTVKNAQGQDVQYFGGQKFNEVLAQGASQVSTNYQFLPFEVYARGKYGDFVGKAFGGEIKLSDGIAAWQNDLKTYAKGQGFEVE
ncbi:ABC transporter, solute-binding protein [Bifidobacterium actinocoloniiforme DSM 22766]|uniref:ABC transporter, solute-binding protein n=2 Tax=Bifidobacterium actinocoloniiforme TaxID=638619 RepID=A0A086Z2K9_9BIFI|nr:sugar ABC transporter substrate-binding protein [Bifidobacterium actinocoloniiforme]AKV55740.1 ABC transporter substrate-binding protein [Bifidobacterium actinocoloniiforme DSM 22766]KFI40759.1 ABC transporter, solute-binding protein [Bifidobacterium actinocoloniiforme DSM 22766]